MTDEKKQTKSGPAPPEGQEVPPISPEDDSGLPRIPDVLPVLPVSELNLFPRMIYPMLIMDPALMAVVQDRMMADRVIGLFTLTDEAMKKKEYQASDLYQVGMAAYILKMSKGEDGAMRVLAQGLSRLRLKELTEVDPYMTARVEVLSEDFETDAETEAMMANIRGLFKKVLDLSPTLPEELQVMNQNVTLPGLLADMVASALNLKKDEKQDFLATVDIKPRLEKTLLLLERQLDILELGSKIQSEVKGKIDKSQRDYFLREQMKAIQDELGEKDSAQVEHEDLAERLKEKDLPDEARQAAQREFSRLLRMNPSSAEYTVSRTYLDWILDLPWLESSPDCIDVNEAQKILDEDHFDLEKVKKRIVEYLAVRQLKPDMKGPILCFSGPPGTGKTSLGRSIARAMGREFVRLSLGGVRDEAEIRGHRRTYVGALPGRIIQSLKKAGSNNPVFMLDEIDKLGADFRGDPSSALLEVLDPEQNYSFSDHYLEAAFDLSKVMFIATANVLDTIPRPLLDRMEVLTLSGYTSEEKVQIAKKFLVPRQREAHGLTTRNIIFRDGALKRIISDYTREAGLRNLEREIGSVCRYAAAETAKGHEGRHVITAEKTAEILGSAKFESEVRSRTSIPGVATGMAWTQTGGDILFIEATAMPGKGALQLTGQLGEVMKESAQAALSYIRTRSEDFKMEPDYFAQNDIHIHVPAGAIPKDGPSAGVTMMVALVSLFTGRPVRSDVSMTGEITLRGQVLPVGGIKEKVLAAKRAGIKHIILPSRNRRDYEEISETLKKGLTIHLAAAVDEALKIALK